MIIKDVSYDGKDLEILKLLEEDSRKNYKDIGEKVGKAASSIHNRINKMIDNEIIKRFTIEVDSKKIGYSITAIILLQIKGSYIAEIQDKLKGNINVYGIYDTTGDWDSILLVKFKKIEDLNAFLKKINKLQHVERTSTSVCLNVIKEHVVFPIEIEKK